MNYYEAKFARQRKDNPLDWLIIPNEYTGCRLVQVGGFEKPLDAGLDFDMEFLRSMDYGMMP